MEKIFENSASKAMVEKWLASNNNFNDTAMDFFTMNFDQQSAIINACLANTAKMINSLQVVNQKAMEHNNSNTYTATKTYRDCQLFLYSNHDEIVNESWMIILDWMDNAKNVELPLALFISKASGKALRKMFYWNAKSASESVDTETMVNCSDCFDSYADIIAFDRIDSILDNVRADIKANCKKTIDLLIYGFNYSEIADMLNVSANTVSKYVSAIVNAIAIVNANDKEWTMLDKVIASDISFKDSISRKLVEKAIIKAYQSEFKAEHEKAIDWQYALERLKASAYYTSNQSSLASLFYSK